MINVAGVNRIIQFTAVLRKHLEDARRDPALLQLFKQMRQVTYAGMPLATELEEWVVGQGVPITVCFPCLVHAHPIHTLFLTSTNRTTSAARNVVRLFPPS